MQQGCCGGCAVVQLRLRCRAWPLSTCSGCACCWSILWPLECLSRFGNPLVLWFTFPGTCRMWACCLATSAMTKFPLSSPALSPTSPPPPRSTPPLSAGVTCLALDPESGVLLAGGAEAACRTLPRWSAGRRLRGLPSPAQRLPMASACWMEGGSQFSRVTLLLPHYHKQAALPAAGCLRPPPAGVCSYRTHSCRRCRRCGACWARRLPPWPCLLWAPASSSWRGIRRG